MASHIPNLPAALGQKKLTTYGGGASLKRHLPAKNDRDHSEPSSSSKSKVERPFDKAQSPRSSGSAQMPRTGSSYHESCYTSASPASKSPTLGLTHGSSSQSMPLRKRDHSVAFATETSKDRSQWQKPKTQPATKSTSTNALHDKDPDETAGTTNNARTNTPARRPRLIDALAAQKTAMGEGDANSDDAESDSQTSADRKPARGPNSSTYNVRVRSLDRRGTTPTNRKVKFTYSQSRTIASESQTPEVHDSPIKGLDDNLDSFMASPRPASLPPADAFAMDDSDDDDDSTQPAIKSVHELRRAGANNRFADEMDDLISRIGVPGTNAPTMRRNALCELVQKLQRKDFLRQFRDHASRDTIARDIGKETDVICGFALTSALLCFLTSGPAPNLLRQLANDGVGKLLARLLPKDEDIVSTAAQKKLNMSRTSRSSIGEVKTILQQLPIWHGYQPADVSPRTAALQLMALLSECADAALLDQILLESQRAIIAVATWASEQGSFEDINYALTVFTLQTQSSAGVSLRLNSDGGHPMRISSLLLRAIRRWPSGRAKLDSSILKLALNTTNTEDEAGAFDDPQLSAKLAARISELFVSVRAAIDVGRLESERYDELLLMLGVMINIMEHCPPARRAVNEDAMDKLMALWEKNQQSAGEADSVEKSKLSVAVGYLSVLLGYMCLAGQAREHLENRVGAHALHSLRSSIQQFVHLYKTVDSKSHALDALVAELKQVA